MWELCKVMSTRIVIQHLTGSKANRIEHLTMEGLQEIMLGRDAAAAVRFDEQSDDAVSRRHALIRVQTDPTPAFWISDLGSRNGTRLNDEPVTSETELLPGDTVELGAGGPRFIFDLQPRPANFVGRTKVISTSAAGLGMTSAGAGPTRTLDTAGIEAAARAAAATSDGPAKVGIGRNTVMHLMADQRQKTNRSWMYVLAGVLAVVGLGGGGLYLHTKREAEQSRIAAEARAEEARIAADEAARQKIAEARAEVDTKIGMSPQEVVRRFGNATVLIDASWRMFDSRSGKEVFHRTQRYKGAQIPCYIEGPNGVLLRWLTTEDQTQTNLPIAQASRGSGFVISDTGFIMTNKHVAAGWMVGFSVPTSTTVALVYKFGSNANPVEIDLANQNTYDLRTTDLLGWVPSEHGVLLFRPDRPELIDNRRRLLEGRGELEVRFPGNPIATRAQVERVSSQADVAIIKINTQQPLTTVQLATDNVVKVGERITVLGYPGFSSETVAFVRSHEIGQPSTKQQRIPEPTVTDGVVSLISPPRQDRGDVTTIGTMGDVYQLTVPSGAGNSGGPAFNAAGKVIGVFTYGSRSRETTTFAVPIKYGRDLMQIQRTE